MTNPKIQCTCR